MMKRFVRLLLSCLVLAGCASQETMETVADEWVEEAMAPAREIRVQLPEEAAVPTVEGSSGRIYLCRDYEIVLQTLESGDLNATIRELSGYNREDLTVIESQPQGLKRYDFVWTAAGEGGDRIGRAVILDDGTWHYTMSVMRDADTVETSQIVWRTVFESFTLA